MIVQPRILKIILEICQAFTFKLHKLCEAFCKTFIFKKVLRKTKKLKKFDVD